jgi:protein ImuB
MAFASIFVPNFMVQAVMRAEPALPGRALVLVDGSASIRTVIGVNAAAAKAGVILGMTKSQTQQFGEIEVRHRSRTQEKIAHAALLDLGWSVSPRVEDTAADIIVLDLAGLASLFGAEEAIASRLAEEAARLGFTTQIAIASNLDAAILSSRVFTGITVIPAGEESAIIGKAPASALSPSTEVLETLDRWGVHTCAALAALPVVQLSERLGQEGVRLHELARARTTRAMVLAQPAIDFEEEMELEYAEAELEPLAFLLGRLLDQLCARLAARSLAASAIRVRFQLEPAFEKEFRRLKEDSRQRPRPSLYERTMSLPVPMRDSKMLLKLLILHLQSDAPAAPIRKITLAAEAALPRVAQGGLFTPISPDPEKVELTMARLAKLVGGANIGSPELLDTHRPEGFRMRRFVPTQDAADKRRPHRHSPGSKDSVMTETVGNRTPQECQTAFRVFRPALPAKVEVRQGCPARVTFPGIRGRVVRASGPWRGSGDWWGEDAWQSDEWDIEIHFDALPPSRSPEPMANPGVKAGPQRGVYRMFYDVTRQEWFVRGVYD